MQVLVTNKWGSGKDKKPCPRWKGTDGKPNYPSGKTVSLLIDLNQAQHCQSVHTILSEKKKKTEISGKDNRKNKKENKGREINLSVNEIPSCGKAIGNSLLAFALALMTAQQSRSPPGSSTRACTQLWLKAGEVLGSCSGL